MEKTKAELSWLEQQKQRIRNKGKDDNYPQINKRQRGLKMRLQEQQVGVLVLVKLILSKHRYPCILNSCNMAKLLF